VFLLLLLLLLLLLCFSAPRKSRLCRRLFVFSFFKRSFFSRFLVVFFKQNLLEKFFFFIHQQSISAFVLSCDGTMMMTMTTTMK